jgi:putative DNA primase/helicase
VKLEDAPADDRQQLHKPTDDELAEIIMEQWEGNYRYFRSTWHKYNEGYWQSQRNVNPFIRDVMMTHKKNGIKPSKAKAGSVEWFLQTELEVIDETSIDHAPEYLNLNNGLFNLNTGKLESHRRDVYVTTKLDYDFDPEADCPRFTQFLNDMLVTREGKTDYQLVQLVQEAFYYSLTADMSRRVSFWVVGPTGSGKSTLINLLVGLMKAYHTTVDLNQIGTNRFILSQVAGKRLVTFGEADANTKLADGIYKMLVSSDEIIADVKNKEPIKFKSQAKIWWGMNNMPVLADRSGAVDVRVLIIPMRYSLPREQWDYQLESKLLQERSGILNWALYGGKRLERRGDFTHVEQVEQAREEFKADNDVELTFVNDWTRPEGEVPAQLLYTAYRAWCLKNGHTPKSSTKVARDWQRLGFDKVKRMDGAFYNGVALTMEAIKACSY